MARKGNLMGVRDDIKVLDATIRDGGLCNNFEFTDEFVTELYKTNIKSGVDYMEFGYKASRNLFNEADFGKWKFCKEEDIRAIVGENISDMKIAVMADVGRCDFKTDFLPKSESVIDMIRVACYIHQIPAAIEMIEYFHDLGYETTCNIMAIFTGEFESGGRSARNAVAILCGCDLSCGQLRLFVPRKCFGTCQSVFGSRRKIGQKSRLPCPQQSEFGVCQYD